MTPWLKGISLVVVASGVLLGIGMIGRGGYEKPTFLPLEHAPMGAISGRVVDGDGKPVAGLVLALEAREEVDLFEMFLPQVPWTSCGIQMPDEISDADGYFRFGWGVGADRIVRVRPTELMFEGQTGAIPVRQGFESSGITLHAKPFGSERLISGVVCGKDGLPLSGVHVSAWSLLKQSKFLCNDTTDDQGAFTLVAPTPTGSARLEAASPEGLEATAAKVPFGNRSLVMELGPEPVE